MSQTTKDYQYDRNDNNTFGVRGTASGGGTEVKANETLAGTEDSLTELTVGETKYKVDQPINVVANPTLAGTESALTGLEVGDTKYKVDSGMTNPMTDTGDIIYGGSDGTPTRLPVASQENCFLRFSAGLDTHPMWARPDLHHGYVNPNQLNKTIFVNTSAGGTNAISYGKPANDFGLGYLTTAPVADNTDGIKIVVLSSEPATRYTGYLYIITA